MDIKELKSRAGIVTESKASLKRYDVKVKVDGINMWTSVYAESVSYATKVAKKTFGNVIGRPSKSK